MLILSRGVDERIVIGDEIIVTIMQVRGKRIRLGIEAPREVSVHRKEIWDRLRGNRQSKNVGYIAPGTEVPLDSPK